MGVEDLHTHAGIYLALNTSCLSVCVVCVRLLSNLTHGPRATHKHACTIIRSWLSTSMHFDSSLEMLAEHINCFALKYFVRVSQQHRERELLSSHISLASSRSLGFDNHLSRYKQNKRQQNKDAGVVR